MFASAILKLYFMLPVMDQTLDNFRLFLISDDMLAQGVRGGDSVEFMGGIHYREQTLTKILEFILFAYKKSSTENALSGF